MSYAFTANALSACLDVARQLGMVHGLVALRRGLDGALLFADGAGELGNL